MNATLRSLSPLERNMEFLDTSLDEVYLPHKMRSICPAVT